MDYLKQYKSFINSYYLSEGVRITIGVALPAIVLSYFNHLSVGIMVSLGALCVSMPDNAGPVIHRKNAMLVCSILIFIVSVITGFAASHPLLLGILIAVFCFLFAMMGVYGSRATSIGMAALLVMVLDIDRQQQGWDVIWNALYILAGGIWYALLSLSLNSFRPYKLAQQALGECIQATADYLKIKASFYEKKEDYSSNYQELLDKQIEVHQKQDLVRELLFKSRNIVRESTPAGRVLVVSFLDIIDLFEKIITSHQDYDSLHRYFDNSDLLEKYRNLILLMANELEEVGINVKSTKEHEANDDLILQVNELTNYFNQYRDEHRNAENLEGFISLRHILNSIEDIANRIYTLESYTAFDKKISPKQTENIDYEKFITHRDIQPGLVWENLNLSSNIFRHSLRLSIATLAGFIVSKFFAVGHSYWILLTIIVIIKPAYSLTKQRNYERLFGTLAGAFIGIVLIYFIKDSSALFVIMIFFMIGSYSFMRTKYLIFVALMTPYILLLFHLLNPNNFQVVITDRIIDTAIGSSIAFMANIIILPAWEHEQLTDYLKKMIADSLQYFKDATAPYLKRDISVTNYKLSRKNAFVSLANLTDTLNRMISEPKSKQKNIQELHQFVVSCHMLISHIATLSYYSSNTSPKNNRYDVSGMINGVIVHLNNAESILLGKKEAIQITDKLAERNFNIKVNEVAERRKKELQQGILESETKKELSHIKPIADQFNFIINLSASLEKMSADFRPVKQNEIA